MIDGNKVTVAIAFWSVSVPAKINRTRPRELESRGVNYPNCCRRGYYRTLGVRTLNTLLGFLGLLKRRSS